MTCVTQEGNTDGKQADSPSKIPKALEIQGARYLRNLNESRGWKQQNYFNVDSEAFATYHTTQVGNCFSFIITGCGRFIPEEIKPQKSGKIMSLGIVEIRQGAVLKTGGVMWKCAHFIVNLQPPSHTQILEFWQAGICYLDSHSLDMKLKHPSLASSGNCFNEPNVNLLNRALAFSTSQQVWPRPQRFQTAFQCLTLQYKEVIEDRQIFETVSNLKDRYPNQDNEKKPKEKWIGKTYSLSTWVFLSWEPFSCVSPLLLTQNPSLLSLLVTKCVGVYPTPSNSPHHRLCPTV